MSDTPRTDAVEGYDDEYSNPELLMLCRQLERENAELADQVMRWFKAASPYATPGSLEEGLKKMERELAEAQNVMSDLPKEHMGEYERMEEYRRQKEMPSKEVLDAITQGRETGFALGLREAAEVAEHYAKLMNSEAAQRAADEIRAMLSEPNAAPADAAPIDSTVKPSAWD